MSTTTKKRYALRRFETALWLPPGSGWWWLDVLDTTTNEVLETYGLGEPVEHKRYTLPDGRYPILWIERFEEFRNKGWIVGRFYDHPDTIDVQFHEICKLPPLVRLAAESL